MKRKRCSECEKLQGVFSFIIQEDTPTGWHKYEISYKIGRPWRYYEPTNLEKHRISAKRNDDPSLKVFYLCDTCANEASQKEESLKEKEKIRKEKEESERIKAHLEWISWLESPEAQRLMENMDNVSKSLYQWLRTNQGKEVRFRNSPAYENKTHTWSCFVEEPRRNGEYGAVWHSIGNIELTLNKPHELNTRIDITTSGITYKVGYTAEKDSHGDDRFMRGATRFENPEDWEVYQIELITSNNEKAE